jgi:thiamine biosynthesis lipoprotein
MPPNYMKSVTVITNDSALGDALSTTLFLMSIEEGKEYIKQFNNVEAIWYTNDNTIIKSDGFDKYE